MFASVRSWGRYGKQWLGKQQRHIWEREQQERHVVMRPGRGRVRIIPAASKATDVLGVCCRDC